MLHAREDYNTFLGQDPSGRIPPDEPVFLLRAQDSVAADTVRHWAYLNERANGDPALTQAAREHAIRMDDWPTKKMADKP